jgi:hypothetical protein
MGRRHSWLAPTLAVVGALSTLQARAQSFPTWTTLPQMPATGNMPQALAAADFDGDGIPDLAVGQSASVAFFKGNGDGTFKAANTVGPLFNVQAVAAGAFITGAPAGLLVVSSSTSPVNNASLIISDHSGGESVQSPFSLSFGSASSVASGDFTGSGTPGFAVTFQQANMVSIYVGNGNGTFTAPKTYATGSAPSRVVVGNFGGHGNRDLAITNSGDDTVTILLGNGDGTFTAAPTISLHGSAGSEPVSLVVADFNGDGRSDLAVVTNGSGALLFLMGTGSGTFSLPTVIPAVQGYSDVVAGDFAGRGFEDVVAVNAALNTASGVLNDGHGNFSQGLAPATGNSPIALVAVNFSGTGDSGVAVLNATDRNLTISLVNPSGSSPTPTPTPTPSPTPTPTPPGGTGGSSSGRLINISTRAQVGTGANILIPGFEVSGGGTETLLIRADGPSLSQFGVSGILAQPSLTVVDAAGNTIAANTGWGTNANPAQVASVSAQVGAFPFESGSADSAVIISVPAGGYTVKISGVGNTTGVALAEIYEVSSTGTRLVNVSTRAQVGTGANIIIPGFVISGTGSEELLVRADGPSLAQFGVGGLLAQPSLSVVNSSGTTIAMNTGWATSSAPSLITSVGASVGAFPFTAGAVDSAQVVTLPAGAYTIQVSGANGTTGVALAEVYEVP